MAKPCICGIFLGRRNLRSEQLVKFMSIQPKTKRIIWLFLKTKSCPYIPELNLLNHGDTVIFNDPESLANQLVLGDNLEVLRTLPSESLAF